MRLRLALVAVVVTGLAPLVALGAVDAEKLFLESCAVCHGEQGNGDSRAAGGMNPKPRNFAAPEAAVELTRERMILSVTYGRPGTAMMPHKDRLSAPQIEQVVDYIRTKFMKLEDARRLAPVLATGKVVYERHCAVCHGDNGNSAVWAQSGLKPPPRDFTDPAARDELSLERMISSVTHGRPGTGMMPFSSRLSVKEIESVVAYIRATFMVVSPPEGHAAVSPGVQVTPKAPTDAPVQAPLPPVPMPHQGAEVPGVPPVASAPQPVEAVDMSLPFPKRLVGNVDKGRQFFMGNCFVCHGVEGDGNGPRAYFNTPRPRNFTSEESRRILNRPRLFTGISNGRAGTVMPAWRQVLTEQDIANVAEFVFQTFVQPDASGGPSGKKKAS